MKKLQTSFFVLFGFFFLPFVCEAQFTPKPVEWGVYSKEEMTTTRYDLDTTAAAVILFSRTDFDVDFSSAFYIDIEHHVRIKILNETAFDDYATIELPYIKGVTKISKFQAQVVNVQPNGEVVTIVIPKEEVIKENVSKRLELLKVAFPKLQVGSIIEYQYHENLPISDIRNLKPHYFQEKVPVLYSEWNGSVPKDLELLVRFAGNGFPLIVNESNKPTKFSNIYHYIAHNLPAIKSEPYVSSISDQIFKLNFVFVSYYNGSERIKQPGTWPDISYYFYKYFAKELLPNREIKQKAEELTNGLTTEAEKYEAIFSFISKEIEWDGEFLEYNYGDEVCADVMKSRKGNSGAKNLLLISMLRQANIYAAPVVIRLRNHGWLERMYPIRSQFEHTIAYVTLGDKRILVDAINGYHSPYELPSFDLTFAGLLVDDKAKVYDIVQLPYANKSSSSIYLSGKLSVDFTKLDGEFSIRTTNIESHALRKAIAKDSLGLGLKELIFEGDSTFHISDFVLENAENSKEALIIKGKFTCPIQSSEIEGEWYLNPVLLGRLETNPLFSEERTAPLDFGSPVSNSYTLLLELPDGFELSEVPQLKRFVVGEAKHLEFKRVGSIQENKVLISTILQNNSVVILPEEYVDIKAFFDIVVQYMNEEIVIRKKKN